MRELDAMERALALARRGWGRVAPNPLVGAVLLREGTVVGEGFHAEYGQPHAEAEALAAASDARGATCVVTLEPCAHAGKTPPCADALIAAGVARAVIAVRDPHLDAGGGADRLAGAGIEVEFGLCADAAAHLNAAFLWSTTRPERPFVALKLATSIDGYIADGEGCARWISGDAARDYVHWLRAGFDAVAVGRRTADLDDPALTARGPVTPRTAPTRIVFSRGGSLPVDRQLVTTAGDVPTTVVTSTARREALAAQLAPFGVRVLGADTLDDALRRLRGHGIRALLVEGGGLLAGALLEADLVDRFYWIQAPLFLGRGTPGFASGPQRALADAARWTVVERRGLGADTLLIADRASCLPAS